MTCTCKYCGNTFTPEREVIALVEQGEISKPDICDECLELRNFDNDEPE